MKAELTAPGDDPRVAQNDNGTTRREWKRPMFDKILIANRGAIAVRIIRTLKDMGIKSVVVYAEADYGSRHVDLADEAWSLGEGSVSDTYLNIERLLDIARQSGAQAVHPGYGFLSENPDFVQACSDAELVFLGPTPDQMTTFGLKHTARAIAEKTNTPLVPGSELLTDLEAALSEARRIGYPIMLKSTAGGGGIGMQRVDSESELENAFNKVKRLSANNFGNDGVFLEKFIARARHIEVQVFGDGQGEVLALGERDCSAQRRHQKVIEETPAPNLSNDTRQALQDTARRLMSAIQYRSAGTVEFIVDADTEAFYFLEVNTRLQVEHGVTEQVWGVDIVRWMIELGAGTLAPLSDLGAGLQAQGHSIQVRVYAEDPYKDFQPSAGLLTQVRFPEQDNLRIDHWLHPGLEVSPLYDPMLAKVIVTAEDRTRALASLGRALKDIELYGIETNLPYLQQLLETQPVSAGAVTTRTLEDVAFQPRRMDILNGGTLTTVQDVPGRVGHWDVGIPPSGPFDTRSFELGNRLLQNPSEAAGLEITLQGPTLTFSADTQIAVTGADIPVTVNGEPVPMWRVVTVPAGQPLKLGTVSGAGSRAYLLVRGGIQCPDYLGSKSTFTLGQFGGHGGRALRTGDVLHLLNTPLVEPEVLDDALLPDLSHEWTLRVIYGPHGAPDFFTDEDIAMFFSHPWEVHYNSSRTGVRLKGPKPQWARKNGGEAGLHPSNIHDNAYAPGTIDFTGDMPVILGPDGPSLGGFVCPATVIRADLWQLGQVRAGDTIRFAPVSMDSALAAWGHYRAQLAGPKAISAPRTPTIEPDSPILYSAPASGDIPELVMRPSGDDYLLIEFGPQQLDLRLRFRVHALMAALEKHGLSNKRAGSGVLEMTPGIRSLQIHYVPEVLALNRLIEQVVQLNQALGDLSDAEVPARKVYLPLSWDDPACQEAIDKYARTVRADAPWVPSNLEFIRRINDLPDINAVKNVVFDADYVVMGLGDVYLGAPVATPVDPRHRLVTTKYNPARTWTAENSVGIGGAYLCVYGMEGPGGYQFVGRTLQMWNRYRTTEAFQQPWLLRFFDHLKFYPVSHDELQQIRCDFPLGRFELETEARTFKLADYEAFLAQHQEEIDAFTEHRDRAFAAELERWHANGQFNFDSSEAEIQDADAQTVLAEHEHAVESPVTGNVWQCLVEPGAVVKAGDPILVLESMKMEIEVTAPVDGTLSDLPVASGQAIQAGQRLGVVSAD